jgi:hypothetical protein
MAASDRLPAKPLIPKQRICRFNRVLFIAQQDLGGWSPPVGAYLEAFV